MTFLVQSTQEARRHAAAAAAAAAATAPGPLHSTLSSSTETNNSRPGQDPTGSDSGTQAAVAAHPRSETDQLRFPQWKGSDAAMMEQDKIKQQVYKVIAVHSSVCILSLFSFVCSTLALGELVTPPAFTVCLSVCLFVRSMCAPIPPAVARPGGWAGRDRHQHSQG